MRAFIEGSVFLRTLNYLRVRHPFALRYNVSYPAIGAVFIGLPSVIWGDAISYFNPDGVLASFVPVLSILAPFFIASLAAVSTFGGPEDFDEPFKMNEDVTLSVTGEGGDWVTLKVTPRHFLSLLFGYCSVVSIALLAFSIFAVVFKDIFCAILSKGEYIFFSTVFVAYFFFLCQLALSTLLGVYYLADKVHRV